MRHGVVGLVIMQEHLEEHNAGQQAELNQDEGAPQPLQQEQLHHNEGASQHLQQEQLHHSEGPSQQSA